LAAAADAATRLGPEAAPARAEIRGALNSLELKKMNPLRRSAPDPGLLELRDNLDWADFFARDFGDNPRDIAALRGALKAPKPFVRARAVELLGDVALVDIGAQRHIWNVWKEDLNPHVREQAQDALLRLGLSLTSPPKP
jgi:HEAT repeat protein